ncbi:NmrA family domain-containing protein 1 [Trichoderma lentiforme]|uniref:NmrA family domain-containing protein 1 n=1 Tax=Trichoderma lentiforme TaxID=1567552 RepID=A0A9P4X4T0_9HYPO|nr:NmrA family domain-containing protein 1 [Trichoderma lentiforme]
MAKLIVIIGITGIQGSSVANVFLKETGWKIRGITRDPSKPESKALAGKGIEILKGDVNDFESIKIAVRGASVVFGNTVFPEAFVNPSAENISKLAPGPTLLERCYETELQQGKNVADAVATVDDLELFVWSSLSHAKKWSGGKYTSVYHFDSKAHVVDYINMVHPNVAKKMSVLQLGFYVTNWKLGEGASIPLKRRPDGSIILRVPGNGDMPVPFIVPEDTGYFVKALTQVPAGKNLIAFGDRLTWDDYIRLWSNITGIPAVFERTTVSEHAKLAPWGFGKEIAEMLAYAQEFGYDGSDPTIVSAQQLEVDVPVTRIEQYIRNEDWSSIASENTT